MKGAGINMKEFINARNPILPPDFHIPDGEGHVMPDGQLYIYGSFDDKDDLYCSEKYHVVSTADMMHWKIHDVALHGKDITWFGNPDTKRYPGLNWSMPTPFVKKMNDEIMRAMTSEELEQKRKDYERMPESGGHPPLLYAPDAIYKDGKYYLYFCMSDDSEGVAVSDFPEGPFENPLQLPCSGIDPAIFVDDDGQVYYYWGQLHAHGVRLHQDMVSFFDDKIKSELITEEEHFFHEGISIRKIGDTYYLIYTNMERGKATSLGYATGKNPLGPFQYRGIIIDNAGCDPESWNNHGSIERVNGQWYVFYHRSSRNTRIHRRLCIEPIMVGEGGSIKEVVMTSQGPGLPFSPEETIMGYQACEMRGAIYIDADEGYGEKLTGISNGDIAIFKYIRSANAFTELIMTARGSGSVEVYMNGISAGKIELVDGEQTCNQITMEAGEYELMLGFRETENLEILEFLLK